MDALATFMKRVNNLFIDILDKGVVVFLDDIFISGNTSEEYFKLLKKLFICLNKYAFYCNLKKCSLLWNTTTFLEFNITLESVYISNFQVINLKE